MRIGICDDNRREQKVLERYCLELGYKKINFFSSGEEFLQSKESLDILFLDIEMKEINGIRLKELLEDKNSNTYIIFYTTHNELMPDAFGRNVIGFLRKPVTKHEIQRCINKAKHLHKGRHIITLDKNICFPCNNLFYMQAERGYTLFYNTNNECYSNRRPLNEWCSELQPYGFCLISRSYAINFKHVVQITPKNLCLADGTQLPISRRLSKEVQKAYSDYKIQKI